MTFQPNIKHRPPPDHLRTTDPTLFLWLQEHFNYTWKVWFPKQRSLGQGVHHDALDRVSARIGPGLEFDDLGRIIVSDLSGSIGGGFDGDSGPIMDGSYVLLIVSQAVNINTIRVAADQVGSLSFAVEQQPFAGYNAAGWVNVPSLGGDVILDDQLEVVLPADVDIAALTVIKVVVRGVATNITMLAFVFSTTRAYA